MFSFKALLTAALFAPTILAAPHNDLHPRKEPYPAAIPQSDNRFPMVGLVMVNGSPVCTGTLVGPRAVLTGGRCSVPQRPGTFHLTFHPHYYHGTAPNEIAEVITVIQGGDFLKDEQPMGLMGSCSMADDWAILVLDRSLGNAKFRYMVVGSFADEEIGKEYWNIVGYPSAVGKDGRSEAPKPWLQERVGLMGLVTLECPGGLKDSVTHESQWAITNGDIATSYKGAPLFTYDGKDAINTGHVLYGVVVSDYVKGGITGVATSKRMAEMVKEVNEKHPY